MVPRSTFVRAAVALALVGASMLPAFARGGSTTTLALTIQPLVAHPGDTITFDTNGGAPNQVCALYAAQIGFLPIFVRLALGSFDAAGDWTIAGTVPDDPAFADLNITFVSYGIGLDQKLALSNYVTVFFSGS